MCIGINPLGVFSRMKSQWRESQEHMNEMNVNDANGTKYVDLPEDLQNLMYE